ncbi:hypothetical protein BpHYR1_051897 [Brachionus plicatilis]|uniref:Uncharacterized protein n=1 Tax=Brachionus plicatilis TaxID=10195 RepID=A0A3M7RLN0_BRAPC|nr:hypothetical protein BpHYR1_051897 [Brachionus plicatilis]
MVSDFLVAHSSCPIFYLNEDEWKKAIEKYPYLLESHGINCMCSSVIKNCFKIMFNWKVISKCFEERFCEVQYKRTEQSFKINSVNAACCNIQILNDHTIFYTMSRLVIFKNEVTIDTNFISRLLLIKKPDHYSKLTKVNLNFALSTNDI